MLKNSLRCHGPQIELQAAREHGDRHFLRIGGGKYKLEVFRRLFQGFEHRIERGVRQHVYFVNHEDFKAPLHRLVNRLLQQTLHFVNPSVGGSV